MAPTPDPDSNPAVVEGEEQIKQFTVNQEFLEFTFGKEVDNFVVYPGSNPGDNYMSVIHAVSVIFRGEEGTKHYVIKCYPSHPGRREMLDQMSIFQKEIFVYDELFPEFQKILDESGADEALNGLSCPPFHGGNASATPSKKYKDSPWANENFIIMTDLRKENYKMGDRMTGVNLEHALIVIKTMAKMHALGWALRQKNKGEQQKHLATKYPLLLDDVYSNEELMDQWKTVFDQICGNALNVLKESIGVDHPAYKNIKKIIDEDMENIMMKFTRAHDITEEYFEGLLRVKPEEDPEYCKEPWLTACHADAWINNVLFKYKEGEGQQKPSEITFVDFQLYRETCPTTDLAYFLNSSFRAPLRNANKDKLLAAYHDSFVSSCKELKVDPFPGFSLKSLKRRYHRAELFGLLVALPLLTFVLKPPEESVDLDKEKDKGIMNVFVSVAEGADKNVQFRDELVTSVLSLYELGVI